MTVEQAIEILRQLAAMANVPLQAHIQAQQAVEVLKKLVQDSDKHQKTELSSVK